jgi:hypothetical protein
MGLLLLLLLLPLHAAGHIGKTIFKWLCSLL